MEVPDAFAPLVTAPARAAVVIDFDGSLAPIVDDPAVALPLPEARDALAALVGRVGVVAVVSGRAVAFLRQVLSIGGLVVVGQYGMEREVDGRVVVDARAQPYLPAVEAAAADAAARFPDLLVERKGELAITLHWRRVPDRAPGARALEDLAATHGLAAHPGRMACELRPPVPVDKGTAIEMLLATEAATCRAVAFAGDDRGDLPAFDALDRLTGSGRLTSAARVGVRSKEAPPELLARADVVVDGPAGLAELLASLSLAVPPRR